MNAKQEVCQKRGYHNWDRNSNGERFVKLASDGEDFNDFDGMLTCYDCNATCQVTGDWELRGKEE